jgi:hypothetical protein
MELDSSFLDRLETDLRRAYGRHRRSRRRRQTIVVAAAGALVVAATASAFTGVLGVFNIDQSKQATIVGTPPQLIECNTAGCIRMDAKQPDTDARRRYELSHRVGDDLPTSGKLAETPPGQGVFDQNGNELSPPAGVELSYVCTTITAEQLECTPLSAAGGSLPRGAAIYVLSPSEYGPAASTPPGGTKGP